MADSKNEKPEEKTVDEATLESLREEFSEDRLREEWDRLQGAASRTGLPQPAPSWNLAEWWHALVSARVPQRVGFAMALVVGGMLAWWQLVPGGRTFQSPGGLLAGLPATLELTGNRAVFREGGQMLLAGLSGGKRAGANEVQSQDVTFTGNTTNGVTITFRGKLFTTNAPGKVGSTSAKDVVGVFLNGAVEVPGQPDRPVRQSFFP